MPAHVHFLPKKDVPRMGGMQRIDLRTLRALKVIKIVALNGLIQERQAQEKDRAEHKNSLRPGGNMRQRSIVACAS